ncbi:MAG TPA: RIP metalloprotease RseP [Candidatus Marinimicrobia bacterium]|jgi:regulator of sigma E protease|nr:RIP metalloprotease RseP [Candidatus Neomarinimicrobiota bacterium]
MTTLWATIIVLGVLVTVHELGHFFAARSVGVRVDRFSIGFPPRLFTLTSVDSGWLCSIFFYYRNEKNKFVWGPVYEKMVGSKQRAGSNTEYCLSIIPLGGYVKMAGTIDESLDDNIKHTDDELMSKTPLQQIWVMSAGVIMNVLLAFVLFSGIAKYMGIPELSDEPVIAQLVPEMPAEAAGLQVGDRILALDNDTVEKWSDISKTIHAIPNTPILIKIQRGTLEFDIAMTTKYQLAVIDGQVDTLGAIGIIQNYSYRPIGMAEAIKTGSIATVNGFGMIVMSIAMLVRGDASIKDIGGPIMIAQLAGEVARAGWIALLTFMALISCNLAFINILPIPGLDGGHILIIVIEGIIRRKLTVKTRMVIQQIGMAFLLLLIVTVIVNDISRLFG